MPHVLHITPHLGGGVGKAVSELVAQTAEAFSAFSHSVATLEQPKKTGFADRIAQTGAAVHIAPGADGLERLAAEADIVQLEFWNHPETFRFLCFSQHPPPMRLVVWNHISGLSVPFMPGAFYDAPHAFVHTSPCSFGALALRDRKERVGRVISSACDVERIPERLNRNESGQTGVPLRAGYVGSLNFSKLHPEYALLLGETLDTVLSAVHMYGDPLNRDILEEQCARMGRPGLLHFHGYVEDAVPILGELDVFVYLLNPEHYGTAENALVEAMAAGAIPITLDNPAEKCIIEDGVTGVSVRNAAEVASALERLHRFPAEREEMGRRASASVRARYAQGVMAREFDALYNEVMAAGKRAFDFRRIFGNTPAECFLSLQGGSSCYRRDGSVDIERAPAGVFEATKGSVFHFFRVFPNDPLLLRWAESLEKRQAAEKNTDAD